MVLATARELDEACAAFDCIERWGYWPILAVRGETCRRGQAVTHKGGVWIALADTRAVPAEGASWRAEPAETGGPDAMKKTKAAHCVRRKTGPNWRGEKA